MPHGLPPPVPAPGIVCHVRLPDGPTAAPGSPPALAEVAFDGRCREPAEGQPFSTGLQLLHPTDAREVLMTEQPVRRGHEAGCRWAETDGLLLVALWGREGEGPLRGLADRLYDRLLTCTRARGAAHLVRIWNYMADINGADDQGDRYGQFCFGRHDAFIRHGLTEADYPAACALGHGGGDLVIYALASRNDAPVHLENPRQVSAYHYPPQYAPRSPAFARATLLRPPGAPGTLFVSGTASVVGHETHAPDDIDGQLEATLHNVDLLLDEVRRTCGLRAPLTAQCLKAYLRRPSDLTRVRAAVEARFAPAPIIYVQADVCRPELLLEVEGTWAEAAP
jgi:chorismate lyase / 3-hydroxybenzoate synthase